MVLLLVVVVVMGMGGVRVSNGGGLGGWLGDGVGVVCFHHLLVRHHD